MWIEIDADHDNAKELSFALDDMVHQADLPIRNWQIIEAGEPVAYTGVYGDVHWCANVDVPNIKPEQPLYLHPSGDAKDAERLKFILRVMSIVSEYDYTDCIWWRCDGEYAPLTIFVNCNDLFYWACADAETLTPENIDAFEQAFIDAVAADEAIGSIYAPQLFCARARKMRPQPPYYKSFSAPLAALFDECGPERSGPCGIAEAFEASKEK